MPESPHPLTPEEFQAALDAECKLAEIDLYADLAALHDEEACPLMREWYAARYRTFIGVHPDHRAELQAALERIADGGGVPVRDLIEQLQRP